MKRFISILILISLLCCSFALGEGIDLSQMTPEQLTELQARVQEEIDSRPEDHTLMIAGALEMLKAGWKEEYDKYGEPGMTFKLDIRGVRVIRLKDDLDEKTAGRLQNAKYIVDFLFYDDLYSDVMGFSGHKVGYYDYSGQKNNVVMDRDGHVFLAAHLLETYRSFTYETDYSSIVEEVTDYRDQYNQIIEFTY